jgi:hypothetical protein
MVKIVERIQKCNHPKLNPANKTKMEVRWNCVMKHFDFDPNI